MVITAVIHVRRKRHAFVWNYSLYRNRQQVGVGFGVVEIAQRWTEERAWQLAYQNAGAVVDERFPNCRLALWQPRKRAAA